MWEQNAASVNLNVALLINGNPPQFVLAININTFTGSITMASELMRAYT